MKEQSNCCNVITIENLIKNPALKSLNHQIHEYEVVILRRNWPEMN